MYIKYVLVGGNYQRGSNEYLVYPSCPLGTGQGECPPSIYGHSVLVRVTSCNNSPLQVSTLSRRTLEGDLFMAYTTPHGPLIRLSNHLC